MIIHWWDPICVKNSGGRVRFSLNDMMWVILSRALPLKMMVVQRPACLKSREDRNLSDSEITQVNGDKTVSLGGT